MQCEFAFKLELGVNEIKVETGRAYHDLVAHFCNELSFLRRKSNDGKVKVNGRSAVKNRALCFDEVIGSSALCCLSSISSREDRVHAGIACLFTIEAGAPRSEVKVLSQCLSYRCRERAILFLFFFPFPLFFPPRLSRHRAQYPRHYRWLTRRRKRRERENGC